MGYRKKEITKGGTNEKIRRQMRFKTYRKQISKGRSKFFLVSNYIQYKGNKLSN